AHMRQPDLPCRCPSPRSTRFSLSVPVNLRHLHSFPTRRSSDLLQRLGELGVPGARGDLDRAAVRRDRDLGVDPLEAHEVARGVGDRKSTRLNSSHVKSSYAVFCLKKKTESETGSGRITGVGAQL